MQVTLTIKNYRCFVRPTSVELSKGFTAFVGVNNAGKSTLMRFLFEFRPLFQRMVRSNGNFLGSIREEDGFNANQVLDSEEIFSNLNNQGLELHLDFSYDTHQYDPKFPSNVCVKVSREMRSHTRIATVGGVTFEGGHVNFSGPEGLIDNRTSQTCVLTPLFEVAHKLANTLYVGPFRNAINVGSNSNYLDIEVGDAFISRFRELKTGTGKKNSAAMLRLTEDIQKIFEFKNLDIEPSHDGKSLHITINGKTYKQHELGSGLVQFILVLANASTKSPQYILIDEPELNLHPRLQLDFLTTLGSYAPEGVWFSTHSLGLARSAAENIYSVRRMSDGDSVATIYDATPRLAEFLGEMSFSSHKELGFEQILLVEGPTDVKTFQQVLRKMSADHKFVILSLFGRINGDMAEEISEIMRITPNVSAIIDSEKTSASDAISSHRKSFVNLCQAQSIECHVLERRATENYFTDGVVREVFGTSCRGLSEFESLDSIQPRWSKKENWKLARAMPLEELLSTDLGKFLQKISV